MKINGRDVSNESKLTVFGGVNVIESDDLLLSVAEKFKTLSENKINIEMITTSEIRITCIIKSSDLELAAKSLHKEFIA